MQCGYVIGWAQQEFDIAAALSRDIDIMTYESKDPYLAFAKQAEAVRSNTTKENHSQECDYV